MPQELSPLEFGAEASTNTRLISCFAWSLRCGSGKWHWKKDLGTVFRPPGSLWKDPVPLNLQC